MSINDRLIKYLEKKGYTAGKEYESAVGNKSICLMKLGKIS